MSETKKRPFYSLVFKLGEEVGKNKITLVKELPNKVMKNNRRYRRGLFKCYCGKEWRADFYNVYIGASKSCGCLKKTNPSNIIHNKGNQKGRPYSYIYGLWTNIKARCFIKSASAYLNYGAKGITMFEEWAKNYQLFENDLLSLIGNRPTTNHQLDRIDGTKGYYPENIRWEDKAMPFLNRKNNVVTKEDVLEIKWLLSLGKFTSVAIARDYLISSDVVYGIKANKIHKFVTLNK